MNQMLLLKKNNKIKNISKVITRMEWVIYALNKKHIVKSHNGIFDIFTHLTDMEKVALYKIAKGIKKGVFVEIGSYLGASSCFLAAGLKKGSVYCIDTWGNDGMTEGSRDTFLDFKNNTMKYSEKIIPVRGWSYEVIDEIKEQIKNEKIDLLFIDGDHSYDGAKKDWDLYSPLLEKNAVVIFHDYGWADGVKMIINEDVMKRCIKYKSLPNMWWGWIK